MIRSSHLRPLSTALVGAVSAAALVAATPVAVASSPHQVDQSTLQPALNPQFAPWSCFETGTGITCQGSYSASYSEPIGLFCDGQEVWITGTAREFMTRWHTADGLATKTVVHLDIPADVFSLSPAGDGPSLSVAGHFNRHYSYPVPGDRESRVLTEKGQIYLATAGGRVVLKDVGTVEYEPGQEFESVSTTHGLHEFLQADFDALICEAVT